MHPLKQIISKADYDAITTYLGTRLVVSWNEVGAVIDQSVLDSIKARVDLDIMCQALFNQNGYEYFNELIPVKIYNHVKEEVFYKHFHDINYITEVTTSLYPKRTFSFGVLTDVHWYADSGLTDLILHVNISYVRDALNFAVSRVVTRTWYREDGTPHPDTKVTNKNYIINPQDQLDEIIRKRDNNVKQTNLALIGILPGLTAADPNQTAMTAEEVILSGQSFYNMHSVKRSTYVNDGAPDLEQAVRDETDPQFGWMNTDATSLNIPGVTTIRGFIIWNLSDGARTS